MKKTNQIQLNNGKELKVRFLYLVLNSNFLPIMNKNQQKIATIITCFLLLVLTIQQCPAQLDLSGVETGSFSLHDLNLSSDPNILSDIIAYKEYTLQLRAPLINANILLSLGSFSLSISSIDLFDINIVSKTDSQFVMGFIYESEKWNLVVYRYMVTNRSSELMFQMVTFSSEMMTRLNKNDEKSVIIAEASLDHGLIAYDKFEVLGFVRGLKYKNVELVQHCLSVTIISAKLTSSKVSFNISSSLNLDSLKVELQLLSISFLYFNPQQFAFASFGGLIPRSNFIGMTQVDILQMDLPTTLYPMYGLTSIDISGKDVTITAQINEDFFFTLSASTSLQNIAFTYFVIAKKPKDVCYQCGSDNILSRSTCVNKCGGNQIYYEFKDLSKACQECLPNEVADVDHRKCVKSVLSDKKIVTDKQIYVPSANQSFTSPQVSKLLTTTSVNSQVQVRPIDNRMQEFRYCNTMPNSYWTGESCQCKVGFNMSAGICIGIVNQERKQHDHKKGTSQHKPQLNTTDSHQQYSAQNITSTTPLIIISCPSKLQLINPITGQCQCINSMSYMQDPTTHKFECVNCKNFVGFYEQLGYCRYCGKDKIYDSSAQKCICKDGYVEKEMGECIENQSREIKADDSNGEKGNGNDSSNATTKDAKQSKDEQKTSNSQPIQQITGRLINPQSSSSSLASNPISVAPTEMPLTKQVNVTSSIVVEEKQKGINEQQLQLQQQIIQSNVQPLITKQANKQQQTVTTPIIQSKQAQTMTNISTPVLSSPQQQQQAPPMIASPAPALQCMKLSTVPQINAANLFITLQLPTQKTFKSQDQMRNFLKQEFPSIAKPSSVYCTLQQESNQVFQCLLLYPNGVPNSKFDVKFWYDQEGGNKCELNVTVDPLEAAAKSGRLRRRGAA